MKKRLFGIASKLVYGLCAALYGNPTFAAVAGGKDSVQGYLVLIMLFINNVILPLLFSIALLFFLINAARYFVIEGGDSGSRDKARLMALYGIGAFVFLVSIWAIVNMLVSGLGLRNTAADCPDYFRNFGGVCGRSSSYRNGGGGLFINGRADLEVNVNITGHR